jgi:hypothetical protein
LGSSTGLGNFSDPKWGISVIGSTMAGLEAWMTKLMMSVVTGVIDLTTGFLTPSNPVGAGIQKLYNDVLPFAALPA